MTCFPPALSRLLPRLLLIALAGLAAATPVRAQNNPAERAELIEAIYPVMIAALEANIDATEESLDDPSAVAAYDSEFHLMLEKTARNRVLELAREPSNMLIYPTTHVAVQGTDQGGRRLVEAHRMLVQALRLRDKELGRLWTKRHLNDWRKGFERTGNDLDQPVDLVTAPVATA